MYDGSVPEEENAAVKQPIPRWRTTLYSLFFAIVPGLMMLAGWVRWQPAGLLLIFVSCFMAWLHGHMNGRRAGRDAVIVEARAVIEDHRQMCNEELERIHKRVDEHITKTEQQINEGEEWKRGYSDQEEPNES